MFHSLSLVLLSRRTYRVELTSDSLERKREGVVDENQGSVGVKAAPQSRVPAYCTALLQDEASDKTRQ